MIFVGGTGGIGGKGGKGGPGGPGGFGRKVQKTFFAKPGFHLKKIILMI